MKRSVKLNEDELHSLIEKIVRRSFTDNELLGNKGKKGGLYGKSNKEKELCDNCNIDSWDNVKKRVGKLPDEGEI